MLKLKCPEATEKKLVLGDYMTVHAPGFKASQFHNAEPSDMQVHREELFQRIQKQRGEVLQRIQKPAGDLIDVRLRTAGANEKGWKHFSDVMDADEKFVA